jgi:hypothetical protein
MTKNEAVLVNQIYLIFNRPFLVDSSDFRYYLHQALRKAGY